VFALLFLSWALGATPELNDDSFEQLRDAIRPREEEQAFLEIGWHESFFSAVNEAHETNRPILLWTMNGHPLGCT
jgi:4-amino-4-deoxy-L-arabinose transferase-like glycosyltransferase